VGKRWLELVLGEPGQVEPAVSAASYRWFLCRAEPVPTDGEHLFWYGTDTDIEDRKGARQLRRSEQELRRMISHSQTIVVLDPDGNAVTAINRRSTIPGLTMEAVRAPSFRELVFHPRTFERLRGERRRHSRAGFVRERAGRARGGRSTVVPHPVQTRLAMEMEGCCIGTRPEPTSMPEARPNKACKMRTRPSG